MSKPDNLPFLRKHFPDYGDLDFELPEGFTDASWGVNACPSFQCDELEIRIFTDYLDPKFRAWDDLKRFSIFRTIDGLVKDKSEALIDTDNWAEIVDFVENLRAESTPRP